MTLSEPDVAALQRPVRPPTEEKTVAEMFASYSNEVTYNENINTPTVDEWDDL